MTPLPDHTPAIPWPLTGPDRAALPGGQPRPIDPATGKPVMSRSEASFHAHVSGMGERAAAEASGGDPQLMRSLLDCAAAGAVGGPVIGDLEMHPMSLGTLEALQKAGSVFTQENPEGKPMPVGSADLALAALIFARPEWAYYELEAGRGDAVKAAAVKLSFHITARVLKDINEFVKAEMEEFFGTEAEEKKPDSPPESGGPSEEAAPPATPPSPGNEEAPAAAGSPPSSSC